MRFEFFIAIRYLRAKRRQAVIGVITGISIAGVAAGVASLIVALSINNGFRQDLQDRLLGSTSHVNLLRIESDGIKDWRPLMDRLSKQPHVVATAPAVYEQVLISRGARARGAVLKGMIPAYERKVSDLLRSVNIGSADALEEEPPAGRNAGTASEPGSAADASPSAASPSEPQDSMRAVQNRLSAMPPIILGKDMAENLGATVGSVVLVTSPQGELTPFGMVPKYNRFRVAGIFNSGFYDYDSSWAFARLSDTQRLFGIGDQVSVIEFKLDDIYQAGQISQQLERAAGPGFMATNWMEQNKAIFQHSDCANHDGDGKDPGHCRAHVDGNAQIPGAARIYRARRADRPDRYCDRSDSWIFSFLGGRTLPLSFSFARGLLHRLCSFRASCPRWRAGSSGRGGDFIHCDGLPILGGCAHPACGSLAVRMTRCTACAKTSRQHGYTVFCIDAPKKGSRVACDGSVF